MVMTGSNNKAYLSAAALLSVAQSNYDIAELVSENRKQYKQALSLFVNCMESAKKENNIVEILALEKSALAYNSNRAKNPQEKQSCLEANIVLLSIFSEWEKVQDKRLVLKEYNRHFDNNNFPISPIKNLSMSNHVDSLSRRLKNIAGKDLNATETKFYRVRTEALKHISQEHYKLLNTHLGLDVSKEKQTTKTKTNGLNM